MRDSIAEALALSTRPIAQSAVQQSHTGDTNTVTLATFTIPGGSMGANGRVEIELDFSALSGTSSKTFSVTFGGSTTWTITPASTTVLAAAKVSISNRNATNSQRWQGQNSVANNNYQSGAGATSIDTTADVVVNITGACGNSADTIRLEGFRAILYPKG